MNLILLILNIIADRCLDSNNIQALGTDDFLTLTSLSEL